MNPSDIASLLASTFDPTQSLTVEEAIAETLRFAGYRQVEAAIEADATAGRVLASLRSKPVQELPFDISDSRPVRLVGKRRGRARDSEQAREARAQFDLVPALVQAIYEQGPIAFEHLVRRCLVLDGASESLLTGFRDEGGIDVYGRIPIRNQAPDIPESLLRTALVTKELLFLAQCKCLNPSDTLGRPVLDQFEGAVSACMAQYDNNPHPPTNRVPEDFYHRGEAVLKMLFTTAEFSVQALAAAQSYDMLLVDGRRLAEFLIARGVVDREGSATMSGLARVIRDWADVP